MESAGESSSPSLTECRGNLPRGAGGRRLRRRHSERPSRGSATGSGTTRDGAATTHGFGTQQHDGAGLVAESHLQRRHGGRVVRRLLCDCVGVGRPHPPRRRHSQRTARNGRARCDRTVLPGRTRACFARVFVGTVDLQWTGTGTKYIEGIQDSGVYQPSPRPVESSRHRIRRRYPATPIDWYLTYEANLNDFFYPRSKAAYRSLLTKEITALTSIRATSFAWSPAFWYPHSTYSQNSAGMAQLRANLGRSSAPRGAASPESSSWTCRTSSPGPDANRSRTASLPATPLRGRTSSAASTSSPRLPSTSSSTPSTPRPTRTSPGVAKRSRIAPPSTVRKACGRPGVRDPLLGCDQRLTDESLTRGVPPRGPEELFECIDSSERGVTVAVRVDRDRHASVRNLVVQE